MIRSYFPYWCGCLCLFCTLCLESSAWISQLSNFRVSSPWSYLFCVFFFFSLVAEAGVNMKSTTSLSLENSCPWYFYWIKFENISVHNSGTVNCYPWKIYSWEPKWRHLWCGGTGSLTPWFIPFSNQIFFFWSTNIFFKKGKRTKPSLASSSVSIHPTLPSMI